MKIVYQSIDGKTLFDTEDECERFDAALIVEKQVLEFIRAQYPESSQRHITRMVNLITLWENHRHEALDRGSVLELNLSKAK